MHNIASEFGGVYLTGLPVIKDACDNTDMISYRCKEFTITIAFAIFDRKLFTSINFVQNFCVGYCTVFTLYYLIFS